MSVVLQLTLGNQVTDLLPLSDLDLLVSDFDLAVDQILCGCLVDLDVDNLKYVIVFDLMIHYDYNVLDLNLGLDLSCLDFGVHNLSSLLHLDQIVVAKVVH